jgi:hypothetical protein
MESLSIGARLWLAFIVPWKILFDGVFAARVDAAQLSALPAAPPKPEPASPAAPVAEVEADEGPDDRAALQLLAILQREGRLVDFLFEDVSGFSDADIGAAARVVHQGCKRALDDIVDLKPVRTEVEGAAVELPAGYDAVSVRVTGNVVGEPPFSGTLAHPGWRVTRIELPTTNEGHDATIIAAAEVEL